MICADISPPRKSAAHKNRCCSRQKQTDIADDHGVKNGRAASDNSQTDRSGGAADEGLVENKYYAIHVT